MVFVNILVFVFGFILLIKGSEYFVESASTIAKRLGVSEFLIGLTVVALGTSIPELGAAIAAMMKGSPGLIVGNVVGSNIANIGLVIGLAALLTRIKTTREMLKRDGYIMLFAVILFFVFSVNRWISWWESLVFLLLYFAYILFLLEAPRRRSAQEHAGEFIMYLIQFRYLNTLGEHTLKAVQRVTKSEKGEFRRQLFLDFLVLTLSGIAIIVGAKYLIQEAVFFVRFLGVSETFIGILVIGLGTSLPEVSVTISAAKKKLGDIALGNILGSNIANVFLILGVSGLMGPINVSASVIQFSLPFMIFLSALLLIFVRSNWRIGRAEGIIFLLLYVLFIASLIIFPALA